MLLEIFLRELSSHEVVPRLSVYGIAHYYGKYLTLTYEADLYTVSKLLGTPTSAAPRYTPKSLTKASARLSISFRNYKTQEYGKSKNHKLRKFYT